MVWKELMQLRRQPEFVGQILAAPLGLAFLLFIGGYQKVMNAAVQSGTNISVAVMLGLAYMLLMASSHMLATELKCLWLLQCQPRELADMVRSKARVWGVIALLMSLPFFGVAIAMPAECDANDSRQRAVRARVAVGPRGIEVRPHGPRGQRDE